MKISFDGMLFLLSACLFPISVMAQGPGTPTHTIGFSERFAKPNRLVPGTTEAAPPDLVDGASATVAPLVAAGSGIILTDAGLVEGAVSGDSKVHTFKGIPFAAPPVGALRWKAPQPVARWGGVRKAIEFGARCMQARIYDDMVFRDHGPSEDCLYLNVWTPSTLVQARLPVMVWIYGGGFAAGSASEPRQDGENLEKKGVVAVSFNYRLGVFGFFSHPELSRESGHSASGNYGLLDQVAALEWVRKNIAAFGGDADNVTIFGESAGSFSVSALMASPLAQDLFQKAIGESGAFFGNTLPAQPLALAEQADQRFADSLGAHSLEALRALPADALLKAARKQDEVRFRPIIDGYFLPDYVRSIFASGRQSQVPLLAGWNADEGDVHDIFAGADPTAPNFIARAHALFGDKADAFLKLYPAATDDQAKRSAQDLAGDQFIAYSTWKWVESQAATGNSRVFRYEFDDAPPAAKDSTAPSRGAYHSAEIEFVFEALASKNLPWRPEDEKLSDLMSSCWTNFARTGDPNGPGLPHWPAYSSAGKYEVMHLSASPYSAPDMHRSRYEFLDALALQELGRTQVSMQEFDAASENLKSALAAGAGPDARLQYVEALLGAGRPVEANVEMNTYLNGRDVKEMPVWVRQVWANVQNREKAETTYFKGQKGQAHLDFLQHPPPDLTQGLEPAKDQERLIPNLDGVGAKIMEMAKNFPNTSSLELIHQEKLGHKGDISDEQNQKFRYLCMVPSQAWGPGFVEYRSDLSGTEALPRGLAEGFMLTKGFASTELIFHPDYRSESTFRYLGRQKVSGRSTFVVAFAQIPGKAHLNGNFRRGATSIPTYSQGLAWIDTTSYQIVRLHTDLLTPLPDLKLDRVVMNVDFNEVHFKQVKEVLWLPQEVTVTLNWNGRELRNTHDYSDFKIFNVEASEKIGRPKEPARSSKGTRVSTLHQ